MLAGIAFATTISHTVLQLGELRETKGWNEIRSIGRAKQSIPEVGIRPAEEDIRPVEEDIRPVEEVQLVGGIEDRELRSILDQTLWVIESFCEVCWCW